MYLFSFMICCHPLYYFFIILLSQQDNVEDELKKIVCDVLHTSVRKCSENKTLCSCTSYFLKCFVMKVAKYSLTVVI